MTGPTAPLSKPFPLPGHVARRLLSPALVVSLERVRTNLAAVVRAAGGEPDRLRPHLKTTKIPAVWDEAIRAGVRAFKCATPREAAVFAGHVARHWPGETFDLLVAYPLCGPALAALAEIGAAAPRVKLAMLVEDPHGAGTAPPGVGLFVDLDPGGERTGIRLADRGRIDATIRGAGARLRGLHAYEGHLGSLPRSPRRDAARAVYARLADLVSDLERDGVRVPEVVTSGTPSFLDALEAFPHGLVGAARHRVSPGTVLYHDLRAAEQVPELPLVPAAVVMARVVSRPAENVVTADAGSKALATDAGAPIARVVGRAELVPRAPSEEHLPLEVRGGPAPERGEHLLLVPRHVCPTVNLAREAVLVDGDTWRVVPVAAAGHDVVAPPLDGRFR